MLSDQIYREVENNMREDILNERVFHHMFSSLLTKYFSNRGVDIWDSLYLVPEYPTDKAFIWKEKLIGDGKRGQFEFKIKGDPPIVIEWKGPKMFKGKKDGGFSEVDEVMIKLLSQEDNSELKVFAAIITTSKNAGEKHTALIKERLKDGVKTAIDKLDINNLGDKNLFVYVATVPNEGSKKIFWGRYERKET